MIAEKNGKCIIVSAPSGAGKTTIVRSLLNQLPMLSFSISACSRGKRINEVDGRDYYFVGIDGFKQLIKEESFVEWEEVYENNYYGTLKKEISQIWSNDKVVVFDVDVVGGLHLKQIFSTNSLAIFIQPPSIEVLESRLRSRNTESEEKINMRLSKSKIELARANEFDVIVINNELEEAIEQAKTEILNFISS